MWALIISGLTFVAAIVISLGKISERGDEISASHREELLSRSTEADKESTDR